MADDGVMSLDPHAKRNVVILMLAALGAAIVLSSTLSGLQLGPGDPFPGAGGQTGGTTEAAPSRALPATESLPIFRGVLATTGLILFGYLLVRLVTSTNIKRLIGAGLALVAIVVLLLSLPKIPTGQGAPLAAEEAAGEVPSFEYPTSPLGKPPPAFIWLSALVGMAGLATVAVAVLRHRRASASMPAQLQEEAEKAVAAIEAGADSMNVIVRCYLEMAGLIQKERHLERSHSMTVREFEAALEAIALPPGPLRRLRTLFEAVRYGRRKFSAEEEQEALESLNEIAGFVRGGT